MKRLAAIFLSVIALIGAGVLPSRAATEKPSILQSLRQSAMGGVSVVSNDWENVLYANPAGLSTVDRRHVNILQLQAGVGNTTLNAVTKMQKAASAATTSAQLQAFAELVPSTITGEFGLAPMTISYVDKTFGFGVYSSGHLSGELLSPVSPRVELEIVGDAAAVIGKSFAITDGISLGMSLKYFYRAATIDPTKTTNFNMISLPYTDLVNIINKKAGTNTTFNVYMAGGTGADLGLLWKLPGDGQLGFAVQNIGMTLSGTRQTYSSDGKVTAEATYTSTMPTVMKVGYAFNPPAWIMPWSLMDDTVAMVEYQVSPTINIYKSINMAFEKKRFWKFLDLRAGIHSGYVTYGIGMDLGPLHLDYAHFIEEGSDTVGVKPLESNIASLGFAF